MDMASLALSKLLFSSAIWAYLLRQTTEPKYFVRKLECLSLGLIPRESRRWLPRLAGRWSECDGWLGPSGRPSAGLWLVRIQRPRPLIGHQCLPLLLPACQHTEQQVRDERRLIIWIKPFRPLHKNTIITINHRPNPSKSLEKWPIFGKSIKIDWNFIYRRRGEE